MLRAPGSDARGPACTRSYTAGMTHRVGAKGQVVIPKDLREALSLHPGDEVEFALDDGAVRVVPARPHRARKGAFAGLDLVAALEADRAREPR